MKTESLKEIIELCCAGKCSVTLEARETGIVITVATIRASVSKTTTEWLDRNDKEMAEKLEAAVQRVQ